jgi:hypothetical protein
LKCSGQKYKVSPRLACNDEQSCRQLSNRLNSNLSGNGEAFRVDVIAVGKLKILSEQGGDRLSSRFIFYIQSIENTIPIASNASWPWEKE